MISTKINLVKAAINRDGKIKDYFSIENSNGILLVDEELFVISFSLKEELFYYEIIKEIGQI